MPQTTSASPCTCNRLHLRCPRIWVFRCQSQRKPAQSCTVAALFVREVESRRIGVSTSIFVKRSPIFETPASAMPAMQCVSRAAPPLWHALQSSSHHLNSAPLCIIALPPSSRVSLRSVRVLRPRFCTFYDSHAPVSPRFEHVARRACGVVFDSTFFIRQTSAPGFEN